MEVALRDKGKKLYNNNPSPPTPNKRFEALAAHFIKKFLP